MKKIPTLISLFNEVSVCQTLNLIPRVVRFDVAPQWVADGFIMTDTTALEMLSDVINYANDHELAALVISAPDAERISEEQGYLASNNAELMRQVLIGSPQAYAKASVANTLLKAITALEQTQDNKQVVKELHSSLALLTGNKPISDIIWFPTPE